MIRWYDPSAHGSGTRPADHSGRLADSQTLKMRKGAHRVIPRRRSWWIGGGPSLSRGWPGRDGAPTGRTHFASQIRPSSILGTSLNICAPKQRGRLVK